MESDRAHTSVQIFFLKTNSPSRKNMMFSKFQLIAFFSHIMLCNLVWNWFLPSLLVYLAASPGAYTPLWLLLVKGFSLVIKNLLCWQKKLQQLHFPCSAISRGKHRNEARERLPPPCSLSKKILYYFIYHCSFPKGKPPKDSRKFCPVALAFLFWCC